jgi:hypothetical protein
MPRNDSGSHPYSAAGILRPRFQSPPLSVPNERSLEGPSAPRSNRQLARQACAQETNAVLSHQALALRGFCVDYMVVQSTLEGRYKGVPLNGDRIAPSSQG